MRSSGAPFLTRLASVLLVTAICWSAIVPNCTAIAQSRVFSPAKRTHPPLALAQLAQAKAMATDKGVLVEWRTGFEVDNLGFNIYRERNGRREQINPGIIAGSALIVGQGTVLDAGYSYSWFDAAGKPDCTYYLEDIDISGKSTLHPPVRPEWTSSLPDFHQAQLLGNLGAGSTGAQSEWAGTAEKKPGGSAPEAIKTESAADQWAIANQPALKIGARTNGWYHITQPEMAATGFDTSADAGNLRMFVKASEIAIRVSRDNGALTASDYIEFWGQGIDTPSSDTQVYWLVNGAQPGKRIARVVELQADTNQILQPNSGAAQASSNFSYEWFPTIGSNPMVTDRGSRPKISESSNADVSSPTDNAYGTVSSLDNRPLSGRIDNGLSPSATATSPAPSSSARVSDDSESARGIGRVDGHPRTATLKRAGSSFSKSGFGNRPNRRRSSNRSRVRRKRHRRNHAVLAPVRHNHAPIVAAAAPAFVYNVERKDRTVYYTAALNGPADNFFGQVLFGDPSPLTLTLHNIEMTSAGPAQLQIGIQGISPQQHEIQAFLNGTLVGTITLANEDNASRTFSVPLSLLIEGDNAVKLVPVAAGHDSDIVDFIRLTYPHSFKAENNSLQFSVKSTQSARVDGFSASNIRVFDISDVTAVQEIRPIVESSGAGFAVTVPAGARGKARRLVALPDTQLSHPASLTLNQPSTLNSNTNAADLLIISYKDFIPALQPLVTLRQGQGLNVKVVDVEDIYDEFSYGVHTSQAIEDFLLLAKQTWSRAPGYLLLVGDASYDPRNYLGRGFWDLVPSKHVDTFYLETDSDDSLADFDNDGIPEMAVGRLPVRTLAEAQMMVSKVVNFSPANVPQSALMVADWPNGYIFTDFSEQLVTLLPSAMQSNVNRVYRPPCDPTASSYCSLSDAAAHSEIINKINAGVALVNYSGHGNVDIWAGPIFTSTDALALNNGNKLPFVVVMDCLNGYFSDPVLQGLGESLLKAPNGGAVASFASSGLTVADPQHQMGQRMFQLLFSGPSIPIGDASRQSKSATVDIDVRRTWILFGDPTMKIR